MTQGELFALQPALPAGFAYEADFLTLAQEVQLLELIQALPFHAAQYRQWRARRRIVSFGGSYDFSRNVLIAAPPMPEFLYPLRTQVAQLAQLPAAQITHAMIAEYPPATPLGWHRDVPQFEEVMGVSLLGQARLRLRPWPPQHNQRTTCALELEPRSAYLLRGPARWQWQHAISPTRELRYSITFRTRRG